MAVAKRERRKKPAKTEQRKVEDHREDRRVKQTAVRLAREARAGSGGGESRVPGEARIGRASLPVFWAGPASCLKDAFSFACR